MSNVSSGQITIVDYNDAPILSPVINQIAGQMYQTYNVDIGQFTNSSSWDTTVNSGVNLQLAPQLFLGTTAGPVDTCATTGGWTVTTAWFVTYNGMEYTICTHAGTLYNSANWAGYTPTTPGSATTSGIPASTFAYITPAKFGTGGIKVTKNFLGNTVSKATSFRAEIAFTDNATSLKTVFNAVFAAKLFVGQRGVVGLTLTPSKTAFSNVILNQNDTLTLTASLMRGSTPDTSNVTYKWFIDDGVDISSAPPEGISFNTDKSVMTLSAKNVNSLTTFKCSAQDPVEDGSAWYSDSITIADVTDPYLIQINSTVGNIFKRGDTTASTLTADVIQNGYPITLPNPAATTYKWSKLGKTGSAELFATSGGSGVYSQVCYGNPSSNTGTLFLTTVAGSAAATLSGTIIDAGLTGAGLVLAGANTAKIFSCPLVNTGITIGAGGGSTGTAPGKTTTITLSENALRSGTEPVEIMLTTGIKTTMTAGNATMTFPAGLTSHCLMNGDALTNTTAFPSGATVTGTPTVTTATASVNAAAAISNALVVAKTNDRWSTNTNGAMTIDPSDILYGNAKIVCQVTF